MRNSLTLRLVLTSSAWVVATLLVTAVLLVFLFRGHIEQRFDGLLHDHLEELVAASEYTPEGILKMTWRPSDPRFNRPHWGWYWEIHRSGVSLARSDSLWRESLKVDESLIGGSAQVQQLSGPEDEPLQALAQKITFPDSAQPLLFIIAGPVSDIEINVRAFTVQVAITLMALGIGHWIVVSGVVSGTFRPAPTTGNTASAW